MRSLKHVPNRIKTCFVCSLKKTKVQYSLELLLYNPIIDIETSTKLWELVTPRLYTFTFTHKRINFGSGCITIDNYRNSLKINAFQWLCVLVCLFLLLLDQPKTYCKKETNKWNNVSYPGRKRWRGKRLGVSVGNVSSID